MKPFGISFNIGFQKGWPSVIIQKVPMTSIRPRAVLEEDLGHTDIVTDTDWFGFRFDIVAGKLRRPIVPFWKLYYWKNRAYYNPWVSGRHAAILTIPFIIGFYVAIAIPIGGKKEPGAYFGLKSYRVDEISNEGGWAGPEEMGNYYLCNSASWRHDFIEDN